VGTADSAFTRAYRRGDTVTFPIAHHDGNYFADDATLARLEGEDRVAFRYAANPNGSRGDIAGVLSANRRVLGLMPHPERAADPALGGSDGARLFAGLAAEAVLQGA
jgi:phosphoribosylformylglycinamidine synthase